jgi:hypothetical protein
MAPPLAAAAPGFPTGFGPFGSNKNTERHPSEDKPNSTDLPLTVDAPKLENTPVNNSTQPTE